MTTKEKIIILLIFLVSFFIRIYVSNTYPSLLWDEAALGYNAYSILKTGRDEYGFWFPLIFKSFGDYKPGVYIYLTIPFVWLFGLNETAVRFPSILIGSLLPIIFYLFIKETTKSKKLALLCSIVLSINPFNIHFSRGAWESNILIFELLLASYFFFKSKYLFSSLTFAISLYTYQSAKLLVPLIILSLFLVNYKMFLNLKFKIFKFFIIPLFILAIPLIYNLLFQPGGNRLKVVSLFSYPRSEIETNTIISESNRFDFQIFHNQFIFFTRNFLSRYFNHFSPRFLIFEGDWQSPRHSAPYIGVLLYPSILFLIIGLFSIRNTKYLILNTFFFFWLLFAPIPASLTRDSLSAVRSLPMSIPLIYFTSLGMIEFLKKFSHPIIYCFLFTAYLFSFIYYSDLYLNHMIKRSPKDWLYGYKQTVNYLINNQSKYQQIYFSDFYGQPYIYYLFYSKYPPSEYQQQATLTTISVDTGKVEQINNILFKEPHFDNLPDHTLAIFSHDEVLRQNIDLKLLKPLSQIGDYSTFYAFEKP